LYLAGVFHVLTISSTLFPAFFASRTAFRKSRLNSAYSRKSFGVMFVLPIGGADMPVVIALLNAFTGLAAAATGFELENNVLIVSGMLVGASGTLLTVLMGRAMNRSIANVLFGAFGQLTPSAAGAPAGAAADGSEDPFALRLPTLLVANKADRLPDAAVELRTFLELTGLRYAAFAVSAATGHGLGEIGPWLFAHLGIVQVYTKLPGHPPDRDRPFTLRRGQTVEDVARLVHKDLTRSLRYARVWGKSGFAGQQVGREHPVADGDVVELHA